MKFEHISCGPFVNESEEHAFQKLSQEIQQLPGSGVFIILTNLQFTLTTQGLPDDLDMIVIGPTGIHVVEVKHWDGNYLKSNQSIAEREADKLNNKVRRVAALRQEFPFIRFLAGRVFLTKCDSVPVPFRQLHGILFYGLKQWRELIDSAAREEISRDQGIQIARRLSSQARIALTTDITRIGPVTNLERLSDHKDRFHRVYRGLHSMERDRVILHVYDLSATNDKSGIEKAKRAWVVLQRYQKSPYLPRVVDSFQELPEYPGVMYLFSHADEQAPSLEALRTNKEWDLEQRLKFSTATLRALDELHGGGEQPLLHRAIAPATLLVRADNRPLFSGWQWAKVPESATISGDVKVGADDPFAAPEVRRDGLAVADKRSDVFSVCASLLRAFDGLTDERAEKAREILASGAIVEPELRPLLTDLAGEIESIEQALVEEAKPPISRWSDDYVTEFFGKTYRVVSRLETGVIGCAFKVVSIDLATGEGVDTFVAKGTDNAELGRRIHAAYKLASAHSGKPGLSSITAVATEWSESEPVALLQWMNGNTLGYWSGVLELYAQELGETGLESLVLGWLAEACAGLGRLHTAGLVHCDVSPANIIVDRASVTLTDFDLITKVGERAIGGGTPPYSCPSLRRGEPVSPVDDLFALAATFFFALTDRDPFMFDGVRDESRGLAWKSGEVQIWPLLAEFLNRAIAGGFQDALEAREFLRVLSEARETDGGVPSSAGEPVSPPHRLSPNEVPWLKEILKAYPGSPKWGNIETRGLDSDFARDTYVETELDRVLYEDVTRGSVNLVVLCGNAGDGKTSILQHLAKGLEIPDAVSSRRVWDTTLNNGRKVRANLDGAASWEGRSADDLLDEIFQPFQSGKAIDERVHLVAVNDGRLLEWIERYEARNGGASTPLTEALADALSGEGGESPAHIRFVDLNLRSLVGAVTQHGESSEFFDRLLDLMLGGERATEIWGACRTCTAQERCTAWASARRLAVLDREKSGNDGSRLRRRLLRALRAVHQRNEVHITARELKGALSYILFGTQYCSDLHENPDHVPLAYDDLAFEAASLARQGELLRELVRLDPALGTSPRSDRYLLSRAPADSAHMAPRYPDLSLARARRRAFFEWTDEQIVAMEDGADSLGLARGVHFDKFLKFPTMDEPKRQEICAQLCQGISSLETLPRVASMRAGVVPVAIIPRVPTETALWVEKPLARFEIRAEKMAAQAGIESLHRKLNLTYRRNDGAEETLEISFELFALLMDLKDGAQLSDLASDEVFANLSVFTERLAKEDDAQMFAWNPLEEDAVFEIAIQRNGRQVIAFSRVDLS